MVLTKQQNIAAEFRAAGLSRRETGEQMNLKPGTVKKYLQRARARAAARQTSQQLTHRGLSNGDRPVRVRAFSLLPTDNV
jgi:DNA-binding CsgD family transcriptional regulator